MTFNPSVEEWLPVAGWPYEASSHGKVRSVPRLVTDKIGRSYQIDGRTLKGSSDKDGYLRVNLSSNGCRRWVAIHVLICESFHGPKPSVEHEVAHWNGNKRDNTKDNLRWATTKENNEDAIRLQEKAKGSKNGSVILTETDVREIRYLLLNSGLTHRKIGEVYGVTRSTITIINRGVSWSWLR